MTRYEFMDKEGFIVTVWAESLQEARAKVFGE